MRWKTVGLAAPHSMGKTCRRGGYDPPASRAAFRSGRMISAPTGCSMLAVGRRDLTPPHPSILSRSPSASNPLRPLRSHLRHGTPFGCPRGGGKSAAPLMIVFQFAELKYSSIIHYSLFTVHYSFLSFQYSFHQQKGGDGSLSASGQRAVPLRSVFGGMRQDRYAQTASVF